MHKQPPQRILAESFERMMVTCAMLVLVSNSTTAQSDRSSFVWLFRLEGTFSSELPAKVDLDDKAKNPGFTMVGARLEADQVGALTQVRSLVTLANGENARTITEAEWRLDVYDASLRSLSSRVLQSQKVNIYAGETAVASSKFGAVLPDKMVVLLQLVRVSFDDGSGWLPGVGCSLAEDLRTVSCKSK